MLLLMVTASNNRVTQRTNKTVSFSSLYWCSFNLQVTNIRASSQVFHVPSSRSGDAGIRAEDQHRFIVPERCQSPDPHDGLTLRPRQYIQSIKVIKIPTFLLWVPGHGPYGHTWLGHNNLQFITSWPVGQKNAPLINLTVLTRATVNSS